MYRISKPFYQELELWAVRDKLQFNEGKVYSWLAVWSLDYRYE